MGRRWFRYATPRATGASSGSASGRPDPTATPVPFWFTSAVGLGALYASVACFRLLVYLGLCLRRPKDLRRRYGSWAVVTGPTRGLGRSMALELAGRGLSLVLVDLNSANLREVSETLRTTYTGVETKTVVFDLSLVSTARGDEAMRRLRAAIHGLDVGILVNNAGVIRPGALYVHEADVERLVRMIRVNVLALTEVTAAVLPEMLKRGRGAIVNVGSGSTVAVPSFPLYTVYSATKRYVTHFSRSLHVEYKSKGVDVQCQVPFYVHTNMLSSAVKARLSFPAFVATADAYARAAVRWIGQGALCVPDVKVWIWSCLWCLSRSKQQPPSLARRRCAWSMIRGLPSGWTSPVVDGLQT